MKTNKVFKKNVSVIIAFSFLLSTVFCYPPTIVRAEAATLSVIQDSSKTEIQYSVQSQNGQGENADIETTFSQEEIDRIVNEHLLASQKASQGKIDQSKIGQNPQTQAEELLPQNQTTDRFIVKYKNANQKGQTANKVKNRLKERYSTGNQSFDVFVTNDKMKKEDFQSLLSQVNADNNIEYIQPDYQVTIASVEEPDISSPVLSSVIINGTSIILTYNEPLNTSVVPSVNDFTVMTTAQENLGISGIEISDDTVNITFSEPQESVQSVVVNYCPGTSPIQDLSGNLADGFTDKKVLIQNQTKDMVSPVLAQATVNGSLLELCFDEELNPDSLPNQEDFILDVNGTVIPDAIRTISLEGNKLIITLNNPLTAQDTLKISYTPGEYPIMDLNGNLVEQLNNIVVNNITITQINDPYFAQQWALLGNIINEITNQAISVGINLVQAWTSSEGQNATVAVLDTGIDITHEDLANNIWTNPAEIPGNGIDDDNNGYIDDINGWNFPDNTNAVHNEAIIQDEWHGTHIAGIIAAEKNNQIGTAGVAPQAKIMPLQVFKNGTAYTSDIINAIHYAEQMGAQVVNCSWGTTSENIALKEAIEQSNLLFICAAGNSYKNIDEDPVYPAALIADNIISVASINQTGNLSSFSNYGLNSVDIAAPGEEIISTLPGNTYGQSGGTSQATAFVTGEAALILSKYSNANLSEIRTRIISSCDKLSSLTGKTVSGGIIDCTAALADPVVPNNNIIQVQPNQTQDQGGGTPDSEGYDLYSVNEWNYCGNLSTYREFFGTAVLNDKIYIMGGMSGAYYPTNSVEIYDPLSGSSTQTANLQVAKYGLGAATANGKVYAIGGGAGGYYPVLCYSTVEEYDPINQVWNVKTSMPTARCYAGTVEVNGKIYVIGGYNSGQLNTVEEYNPETNTWTTKAYMPTARFGLGVAAVNGKIYAIGGRNWNIGLDTVEEYNPVTNTWTTKASLPVRSTDLTVIAVNGKIYAIGGYNDVNGNLTAVYEYDPNINIWVKRSDLNTPRHSDPYPICRTQVS